MPPAPLSNPTARHLPNFAFPAPQFVHAAATGTPVDLTSVAGRLTSVAGRLRADDGLDLCYVHDLGRAVALLQTADTLTHTTYNVGAGRLTTNAEVIAAIKCIVPEFDVELEPGSSVPPSSTSTSTVSFTNVALDGCEALEAPDHLSVSLIHVNVRLGRFAGISHSPVAACRGLSADLWGKVARLSRR